MKTLARVTVSVPASTSNLGPGFDCLGLALDLRNELTLELIDGRGPALVEISGEGADTLPRGESNMLVRAARKILPRRLPGRLLFKSVNRIPRRGLGLGRGGGNRPLGGAHLFGTLRRTEDELKAWPSSSDPDNVAPASTAA